MLLCRTILPTLFCFDTIVENNHGLYGYYPTGSILQRDIQKMAKQPSKFDTVIKIISLCGFCTVIGITLIKYFS